MKTLQEMMRTLPASRREKIAQRTERLIAEEMARREEHLLTQNEAPPKSARG